MSKIIKFLRKAEIVLLVFFVNFGKKVSGVYHKVKGFLVPKIRSHWKTIIIALAILYAIGGVVFGIRLYSQSRFEKVDLIASKFYPFPVANSGRAIVTNGELQQWVYSSRQFASKNNMEVPADLAQKVTQELANYKIVSQEADQMGIRLTNKEVEEKFMISIEGIGSIEQARDFIKQMYGLSLEQFKNMIRPMILMEKVREEKFVRIKVRHILIKDEGKAKEVLEEVKGGGNFEEIAKNKSEDEGSKENGGLLAEGEFLYKGSGLVDEFEKAAFALKKGQVSELVKTEFGYHIIKAEDRQGSINKTAEEWTESLKKKYPQRVWL
jgi:foldase protein PrsA